MLHYNHVPCAEVTLCEMRSDDRKGNKRKMLQWFAETLISKVHNNRWQLMSKVQLQSPSLSAAFSTQISTFVTENSTAHTLALV